VRGIELPGENRLPPGPARDLVVGLHELYRGAGLPGLRRIAKAIADGDFSDVVSHETVSDMLNGKSVPRWSKLDAVVRQLAMWNIPRLDPESTAVRFLSLWKAAAGVGPDAPYGQVRLGLASVSKPAPETGTKDLDASAPTPTRDLDGSPALGTRHPTGSGSTGQALSEDKDDPLPAWTQARHD
jgi:hypothetical protein